MDNSHHSGANNSDDVRHVHFGSLLRNEAFDYSQSHHDGTSIDLLIPSHVNRPQ